MDHSTPAVNVVRTESGTVHLQMCEMWRVPCRRRLTAWRVSSSRHGRRGASPWQATGNLASQTDTVSTVSTQLSSPASRRPAVRRRFFVNEKKIVFSCMMSAFWCNGNCMDLQCA